MNYYNTTHEAGNTLKTAEKQTSKQDKRVLEFLNKRASITNFTPWELLHFLYSFESNQWLITSVRRCINSLTNSGFLVKTQEKRIATQGRANYVWKTAASIN
jgi:hypothetical protein